LAPGLLGVMRNPNNVAASQSSKLDPAAQRGTRFLGGVHVVRRIGGSAGGASVIPMRKPPGLKVLLDLARHPPETPVQANWVFRRARALSLPPAMIARSQHIVTNVAHVLTCRAGL